MSAAAIIPVTPAHASRSAHALAYEAWLSRSVTVSMRLGGVCVIVTGDDPNGCVRIRYEASGATYAEALTGADREAVRVALTKALASRRVA